MRTLSGNDANAMTLGERELLTSVLQQLNLRNISSPEIHELALERAIEAFSWAAAQPSPATHIQARLTRPFLALEEFLVYPELQGLLACVQQRSADFIGTRVMRPDSVEGAVDHEYRKSQVLFEFDEYQKLFADRILSLLPFVLAKLGLDPFRASQVEVQLTASNDGEFFKVHSDNQHERLQRRRLTFVYYFHQEPKRFAGGVLRLYDTRIRRGKHIVDGSFWDIEPIQNQMVFFPSHLRHEVMPVHCPSKKFMDGRFTVNGWVHR